MSGHAKYAPSSAAQWVNCPASFQAKQHFTDGSGIAAMEGTAAHWLFEHCMINMHDTTQHRGRMLSVTSDDGKITEEFEVDDEMVRNVQMMLDFCRQLGTTPGKVSVEAAVSLRHLDKDAYGTTDYAHDGEDYVLTVVDYKNGRIPVDVTGNHQLYNYAVGTLNTPEVCPDPSKIKWVRLVIVQPRSIAPGPRIKQEVVPVEVVRNYERALAFAIARTKEDNAEFRDGDWCTYCPVLGICPATSNRLKAAAFLFEIDLANATPEQLALLFRTKKMITQVMKRVESVIQPRLVRGEKFPNMKLVTSVKFKQWTNEDAVKQALFDQFGLAGLKPVTPAQAEKLGAEGIQISQKMANTPPGDAVPADIADRRQPYTTRDVQEIFPQQ